MSTDCAEAGGKLGAPWLLMVAMCLLKDDCRFESHSASDSRSTSGTEDIEIFELLGVLEVLLIWVKSIIIELLKSSMTEFIAPESRPVDRLIRFSES